MKDYPLNKYRYYSYVTKGVRHVVAVSTYAGKQVRGVALCASDDTFDMEKGKALAAARCALKVSEKRFARAQRKVREAAAEQDKADKFMALMNAYYNDSLTAIENNKALIDDLLAQM